MTRGNLLGLIIRCHALFCRYCLLPILWCSVWERFCHFIRSCDYFSYCDFYARAAVHVMENIMHEHDVTVRLRNHFFFLWSGRNRYHPIPNCFCRDVMLVKGVVSLILKAWYAPIDKRVYLRLESDTALFHLGASFKFQGRPLCIVLWALDMKWLLPFE